MKKKAQSKGEHPKVNRRQYSAREKCEAVLSVWSERRKPHEIQKDLGVNYAMLSAWQERAMSAILVALEPRVRKEEDRGPALGVKLHRLVERKLLDREGKKSKVQQRLEKLDLGKTGAKV